MSKSTAPSPAAEDRAFDVQGSEEEFPYHISYEILDHAPATSHGTYLEGIQDGVEDLERYEAGGYHPIHLGDYLGDSSRYHVIHKLGYGGFSTVWLCRDTREGPYVAVKVHTADVSAKDLPDLRLVDLDKSVAGAEYINTPGDHFSLEGPNGTHQCLVFTLLGPRVSPSIWVEMEDPGPTLRKMYLRPANILVKLANLDHLSTDEILSLLGAPEQSEVLTESGEDPPPTVPKYLVPSAELINLSTKFMTDQICIIDFGESFPISSPPKDLGIPENYLPPEVILEDENSIGPACDLWALGCTLFEIRCQMPLFYMMNDRDELLAEMVGFFGKLPDGLWEKWDARGDYFDEDGKRIEIEGGEQDEPFTLEVALNHDLESWEYGKKEEKKVLVFPAEEQTLCRDLLIKLFSYTPGERLSAESVLQHEWFKS
ncbi:Serine/threonine-protein kinase SRPK [Lachnellula arida]|uniref:Serine/threonine-protein kinase SRPK n=1 Tax=Lachnellula arida TaxID=1316785 RepID=A0A8T9BCF4_9HELO|nr:Serine/threonine-protein kinase SRPK [Lachnellula arida]